MTAQRFSFWLVLLVLLLGPSWGLAQDTSAPATRKVPVKSAAEASLKSSSIREQVKADREKSDKALEEYRGATAERKLSLLQTYGTASITAREKALTELESRIARGKCGKLDAAVRATIASDIAAVKANLSAEKTELAAATTVDGAKTIVKSVFEKNRVFANFVPAVTGICISQSLLELINGRLTAMVKTLKDAKVETTTLQTELDKATASVTTAIGLYTKVAAAPGGADAHTNLVLATKTLTEARATLGTFKSDLAKLKETYLKAVSDRVKTEQGQ